MTGKLVPVSVQILDKEYRVACPEEERDELIASGRHLNQQMKEVRDAGRVVGVDRIAVMVALNMAHDVLYGSSEDDGSNDVTVRRVQLLQQKIEKALHKLNQIEL